MSLPTSTTSSGSSCGRLRYSDQTSVRSPKNHSDEVRRPTRAGRRTRRGRRRARARCRRRRGPPAGRRPTACSGGPTAATTASRRPAPAAGRRRSPARSPAPRRAVGGDPDDLVHDVGGRRPWRVRLPDGEARRRPSRGDRRSRTPAGTAGAGVTGDGVAAAGVEPVQPLVGELGEPQRCRRTPSTRRRRTRAPGCARSTARAARRSPCRRPTAGRPPIGRPRPGRDSDHHTSSAVDDHLAEPGGGAHDQLGGDRRGQLPSEGEEACPLRRAPAGTLAPRRCARSPVAVGGARLDEGRGVRRIARPVEDAGIRLVLRTRPAAQQRGWGVRGRGDDHCAAFGTQAIQTCRVVGRRAGGPPRQLRACTPGHPPQWQVAASAALRIVALSPICPVLFTTCTVTSVAARVQPARTDSGR